MPQHAQDYAALVKAHEIDILLIQEGSDDWQLTTTMPSNYQRAEQLRQALGQCWYRQWQILVNQCQQLSLQQAQRFDLSDGPNAARAGEIATVSTGSTVNSDQAEWLFINVHWDHQSQEVRAKNAFETAQVINRAKADQLVLAGDFNMPCHQALALLSQYSEIPLQVDGGIDCVFANTPLQHAQVIDADPSDHPAVITHFTVPTRRQTTSRWF